jgi:hypothetical protein
VTDLPPISSINPKSISKDSRRFPHFKGHILQRGPHIVGMCTVPEGGMDEMPNRPFPREMGGKESNQKKARGEKAVKDE